MHPFNACEMKICDANSNERILDVDFAQIRLLIFRKGERGDENLVPRTANSLSVGCSKNLNVFFL
jgi:hypothetical protein